MLRGVSVEMSDEENAEFDALAVAAAKEAEDRAKVKYKSDRKAEYPSVVDQLDKIYHSGIDEWKKVIKVTKDKYPKPE